MTSAPSNFFRFSADQFSERDRVEATREIVGRHLMKMQFELQDESLFKVNLFFRALPDFALAMGHCSAMDCIRTADLIDSNDLVLSFAMTGGCTLNVDGHEIPISRRTAALTRTTDLSHCTIHSSSDLVNFRFPYETIAPFVSDLDKAATEPIRTDSDAFRLLLLYTEALADEEMVASPDVQAAVSTHLQDLAVLAIGANRDAAEIARQRGVPAARLRAIKGDILNNLTDRKLSIETVAKRHGITPRYVSMLFDNDGTTFSDFVLSQRLRRAHAMLANSRFSDQTISSVALGAGFNDLSYFNRTFRRQYGVTPSERRGAALREK